MVVAILTVEFETISSLSENHDSVDTRVVIKLITYRKSVSSVLYFVTTNILELRWWNLLEMEIRNIGKVLTLGDVSMDTI